MGISSRWDWIVPTHAISFKPTSLSSDCIPFVYSDDGCWARAHEMCRLFIAAGFEPQKVWLYGRLRVNTRNHPKCQVRWRYHVAPTLPVNSGASSGSWVIDPSMFTNAIPQATWVDAQHDPDATAVATDYTAYYRDPSGSIITDPNYEETEQDPGNLPQAARPSSCNCRPASVLELPVNHSCFMQEARAETSCAPT